MPQPRLKPEPAADKQAEERRATFLAAMSHAASTVNIVTTDGAAGRAGVTVSAMCSVSAEMEKPTLLICVHHQSLAAAKILENGVFCVNVLRDDQSHISDTFAGRRRGQVGDKFDCAVWVREKTGAPRIVDPLVGFDCSVLSSMRVGTHYVMFGEVEGLFVAKKGSPLIYANRAYGSTRRIDPASPIAPAASRRANALSIGCCHTFEPPVLPALLKELAVASAFELDLVEGDQHRVQESLLAGETELALLYDFDLSPELAVVGVAERHPHVVLAGDHPLAEEARLHPHDLAEHPMVLLNAPPGGDYVRTLLRDAGIEPNVAYCSSSLEMVRSMVAHGLGYSLLCTKPASAVSYDGMALVTRPLVADAEPARIVLARRRDGQLSPVARKFEALCRQSSADRG